MSRWTSLNDAPKDVPFVESSSSDRSHPTLSTSPEKIGPSVRRLLAESRLERSKLRGTGPKGQLVKGDVLAAIRRSGFKEPPSAGDSEAVKAPPTLSSKTSKPVLSDLDGLFDQVPISQIRKVCSSSVTLSGF